MASLSSKNLQKPWCKTLSRQINRNSCLSLSLGCRICLCFLRNCSTKEFGLLFRSLKTTVSKLRGSVNELQVDLLCRLATDLGQQRFAKSNDALLCSHYCTFQHDPILCHLTKVCKASHRCDALFREILLCHGAIRILFDILTDTIDLLVDLCPVVITILACPWNLKLHTCWVPCADTGDLAQASVGLSWQARAAPTCNNAIVTFTPS